MRTVDLDYELPGDLIAQEPATRRDDARLLVLDRSMGGIRHRGIRDLPALLSPRDVLVLNESKVVPARVRLVKETGGRVDALVLRRAGGMWEAQLHPAGRLRPGLRLAPATDPTRPALEIGGRDRDGTWRLRPLDPGRDLLEAHGEPPLPPYIKRNGNGAVRARDRERYQTVYAREPGSVAAPTAGLHFTDELLAAVAGRGIVVVKLTLHVGPGTFRPITAERLADHRMAPEPYAVPEEALAAIRVARRDSRRVVAVGTTCVRVLETLGPEGIEARGPALGDTDLFIAPGYAFRVVGAMLTNFHRPRSTPYALVCALAGPARVRTAYAEAVAAGYRFLSYGDAMLIA